MKKSWNVLNLETCVRNNKIMLLFFFKTKLDSKSQFVCKTTYRISYFFIFKCISFSNANIENNNRFKFCKFDLNISNFNLFN